MEQLRVAVGRVSTHVDDDRGRSGLACGLEAIDDRLTFELTDLLVVERDVVVGQHRRGASRAGGDRAVVRDDRDALLLGLLGHGDSGTVVVDEDHDTAALGELLVRDRRVLVGVALSVLDVGAEAGVGERLLQCRAVTVLPTRRGRRVRKDDTGTG